MNHWIAVLVSCLLAGTPAFAQDKAKGEAKKGAPAAEKKAEMAKKEPSEAQKKQQERMRTCNEGAGAKKLEGDARKKYMSACLKGEDMNKMAAQQDKKAAQQQKMKTCNKDAGDKKLAGEARKKFMSECLKG